ncbi:hypothetical protein D9M71_574040 [compost metagenome]
MLAEYQPGAERHQQRWQAAHHRVDLAEVAELVGADQQQPIERVHHHRQADQAPDHQRRRADQR